ncbi:hypothetical protein BC829DRAFT_222567 [Chytridium lagenaria]|nr:hypothetical protein BC829DRAFT_222567 [Chytridium lagenaria]
MEIVEEPISEVRKKHEMKMPLDTFLSFSKSGKKDDTDDDTWFSVWEGTDSLVSLSYEALYRMEEVMAAYRETLKKFRAALSQQSTGAKAFPKDDALDKNGQPTNQWPVCSISITYTFRVLAVTEAGDGKAAQSQSLEWVHNGIYEHRPPTGIHLNGGLTSDITKEISSIIPDYATNPARYIKSPPKPLSAAPTPSKEKPVFIPTSAEKSTTEDMSQWTPDRDEQILEHGFAPGAKTSSAPRSSSIAPTPSKPPPLPGTQSPAQTFHPSFVEAITITMEAQEVERQQQLQQASEPVLSQHNILEEYSGLRQLEAAAEFNAAKMRGASRSPSVPRRRLIDDTPAIGSPKHVPSTIPVAIATSTLPPNISTDLNNIATRTLGALTATAISTPQNDTPYLLNNASLAPSPIMPFNPDEEFDFFLPNPPQASTTFVPAADSLPPVSTDSTVTPFSETTGVNDAQHNFNQVALDSLLQAIGEPADGVPAYNSLPTETGYFEGMTSLQAMEQALGTSADGVVEDLLMTVANGISQGNVVIPVAESVTPVQKRKAEAEGEPLEGTPVKRRRLPSAKKAAFDRRGDRGRWCE